jgi:hypothetical protein
MIFFAMFGAVFSAMFGKAAVAHTARKFGPLLDALEKAAANADERERQRNAPVHIAPPVVVTTPVPPVPNNVVTPAQMNDALQRNNGDLKKAVKWLAQQRGMTP